MRLSVVFQGARHVVYHREGFWTDTVLLCVPYLAATTYEKDSPEPITCLACLSMPEPR